MKTHDEDHSRLLGDLFPPRKVTDRLDIENVLRSIEIAHAERRNHLHCARILLVTGVVLLTFGLSLYIRHATETRAARISAFGTGKADTPSINTVDDEGLLRMMSDGPAALAEWPDGRQSLFILVTHSAAAEREADTGLNRAESLSQTDDISAELNGPND